MSHDVLNHITLPDAFDEEVSRCFAYDSFFQQFHEVAQESISETNKENLLLQQYSSSPVDWENTKLFNAFVQSLDLVEQRASSDDSTIDLPEDDDIVYAFDHHSLVTSQLPDSYDDVVPSADEIIKEINILMVMSIFSVIFQNHDDVPLTLDFNSVSNADPPVASVNFENSWLCEEELHRLSLNDLSAVLEELESCVRENSANLVQELAYREELDFEQEQKDIFIARLDEMHRRLERRRRSSMPPSSNRHPISYHFPVKGEFISSGGPNLDEDFEHVMEAEAPNSSSPKEPTQFISRAQSAAYAAAAVTSSATTALKKQLRRLSGLAKDSPKDNQEGHCSSSHKIIVRNNTEYSTTTCNQKSNPLSSVVPTITSTRSIAIARLRKWAGRKTNGTFTGESTSAFKVLLRRNRPQVETSTKPCPYGREARSAVTTPTSSQFDFPPISPNLTHSASGHLIGRSEMSSDDLEYKYLTTSIPYHRSPHSEGPTVQQLELFNEMLLAILTNNPNLTPMLTDYILNVYAPADHRLSKLPI